MEQVVNGCKTFTVHWLNNKDLVFNKGVEKLLTELLLYEQQSFYYSPCDNGYFFQTKMFLGLLFRILLDRMISFLL